MSISSSIIITLVRTFAFQVQPLDARAFKGDGETQQMAIAPTIVMNLVNVWDKVGT